MKYLRMASGVLLFVLAGHALGDGKSPNIFIEIDAKGCPTDAKDEEPRPEPGCDKKDVACRHRNESVHWIMKGDTDYAIAFSGGNPFTEDGKCLEAKKNPKCTVSSDAVMQPYDYDVVVEGCSFDPKIVIN